MFEILIVLVLGQILSVTVYSQAEKGKIKTLVVNFMKNADMFKKVFLRSDIELRFFGSGYFHRSIVLDLALNIPKINF